jgi:sarcosine oxidase delta subunit
MAAHWRMSTSITVARWRLPAGDAINDCADNRLRDSGRKSAADTAGLVINADGSTQSNASWNAYYLRREGRQSPTAARWVLIRWVRRWRISSSSTATNHSLRRWQHGRQRGARPTSPHYRRRLLRTVIYVRVRDTAEFTLTQRKNDSG